MESTGGEIVNAEELAESYINGNISHVRAALLETKGSLTLTAEVYRALLESMGKDDADRFLQLMRVS
jgi:hypothetical protein